jgi:NADPH2:quinone reductase
MQAVRVHAFGAPPRVENLPAPEPEAGEVLVRLEASAVGHHDLGVAAGVLPLAQALPYVPGLEGAGRLADGTLVRVYGGGLGMTRQGTWAEQVAVPPSAIVPVPRSLPPELAAACGSAANTAWAALHDLGAVKDDESVGVTGATGSVGSLVVQLAGDRRVVTWSRGRGDEEPEEPVDLLIDTVGGPDLPRRLRAVRRGGRAVLVGYTAGERVELDLPALMHADVALLPLNMRRRRVPPDVTAALLEDFATGRLTLRLEVIRPGELEQGIARLRAGRVRGRLVVRWNET